jgi:hypothetical protein
VDDKQVSGKSRIENPEHKDWMLYSFPGGLW